MELMKAQSKDEISAEIVQVVCASFLDILKSLHVDPHVFEAAQRAVADRLHVLRKTKPSKDP
jgi:hypothetical protein